VEKLIAKSKILIQNQELTFVRSISEKIDWQDRLIGILGARGTGKTTLLIQHLKQQFGLGATEVGALRKMPIWLFGLLY
jgi:predicted AAA+ superfamily ATPase